MRLAYLAHPHVGGTYGVFRHLQSGLAPAGIELRWLGSGAGAHAAALAACWSEDMALGSVAGDRDGDDRALGLALLDAVAQGQFDGVLVNVLTSRAEMNLVRYLQPGTLRLMIVHNITPGTYSAARAIRGHVHAAVGVSRRIRADLVRHHGFDPERTFAVPNGVDCPEPAEPRPLRDGPLRLMFLGRIEDAAKGVFLLPRILHGTDPRIRLTVAGDGPDLPELRARCAALGNRVAFAGEVRRDEVPTLLAAHDGLLMPSRYEGLPLSLIEAMGAGCVPVAARLAGVTDSIITDGCDGWLFPPGSTRSARRAIAALDADRNALRRMSLAAMGTARTRFRVRNMVAGYRAVLKSAQVSALPSQPLDIADWSLPIGMRPGLRTYLPAPAKTLLRTMRERLAS